MTKYEGNAEFIGATIVDKAFYDARAYADTTNVGIIDSVGTYWNASTSKITYLKYDDAFFGNDTINAGSGHNKIFLQNGVDTVYAGAGNDYILGYRERIW